MSNVIDFQKSKIDKNIEKNQFPNIQDSIEFVFLKIPDFINNYRDSLVIEIPEYWYKHVSIHTLDLLFRSIYIIYLHDMWNSKEDSTFFMLYQVLEGLDYEIIRRGHERTYNKNIDAVFVSKILSIREIFRGV